MPQAFTISVPVEGLRIVKSRVTILSQPEIEPPGMVYVAVLLDEV